MVRNALAHGIESPEDRVRAGKSDTGRIHLSAAQRQGKVVIEVRDDGRGIDTAAVLKKARSLGLAAEDAKLSDAQIYDFMFRPGFSTAKEVDEISGRGVGLDVVHRNVTDLRGSIEVESVLGRGTTFRIQLPLTLAIIEGMHVQVGPRTLTIPLLSVVELISAREEWIHTVEGKRELVDVRGEYLPMFRLSALLEAGGSEAANLDSVVVVVENERRKFGIMVDRVLGLEQTVVKPLEKTFSMMTAVDQAVSKPAGIAGATILGDGNVALIVDVAGLERMAFDDAAQ
jgi:two-component system chemotaxis sensor kinase CheA